MAIGKNFFFLSSSDINPPIILDNVQSFVESNISSTEIIIKNPKKIYIKTIFLVLSNGTKGKAIIMEDITQFMRVGYLELKYSNLLDILSEIFDHGILIIMNEKIIFANRSIESLVESTCQNNPLSDFFERIVPEDQERMAELFLVFQNSV